MHEKDILIAIDRDGTLIYDEDGYFGKDSDWREKVKLYEGAIETIKALNCFAKIIVTTNQIGVARGLYSEARVKEINDFLDSVFQKKGAIIDGWYFSPFVEKKWAEKEGLKLDSPWLLNDFPETRKPRIGMLKKAVVDFNKSLSFYKKIFVIGDSIDDLEMALNAGGVGIFFRNGKNDFLMEKVNELKTANPDRIFHIDNLILAVKLVKSI
jgi:D-glycero-D-manno-heptose 1,7-bisphosphate phosphatase